MSCWEILGISPTADTAAIRAAYSSASQLVHPEEHPEEFRTLHDAYRQAIKLSALFRARPAQNSASAPPISVPDAHDRPEDGDKAASDAAGAQTGSPEIDISGILQNAPGPEDAESDDAEVPDEEEPDAGFNIFTVLEETSERDRKETEDLTGEFFAEVDRLNRSPAGLSYRRWDRLFTGRHYQPLLRKALFAERLTEYVREHKDLRDGFYFSVSQCYSLPRLLLRADNGILTGLTRLYSERRVIPEITNRRTLRLLLCAFFFMLFDTALVFMAVLRPPSPRSLPLPFLSALLLVGSLALCILDLIRYRKKIKRKSVLSDEEHDEDSFSLRLPAPAGKNDPRIIRRCRSPRPGDSYSPRLPDPAGKNDPGIVLRSRSPLSKDCFSPLRHIRQARYYSNACTTVLLDVLFALAFLLLSVDPGFTGALLLVSTVFLMTLAALAVVLLTDAVVFFRILFTRKRSRPIRRPFLGWSAFFLFLVEFYFLFLF